jgi:hypothetical protein
MRRGLRSSREKSMPPAWALPIRLARSTLLMWLLVRVVIAVILGFVTFAPREVVIVCLVTLALVWVDIRTFHERLLYENLGYSPLAISSTVLAITLGLELLTGHFAGAVLRPIVRPLIP